MKRGKLYIVGTPIGNLNDVTYSAVEILKSCNFVLAEDTRVSRKLFNRYNISTPLISYRDQNHSRMIGKIREKLDMGLNLALISDSGTPLISDPGFKLVRELRENGYSIESVPGPSAVISALSISGLPTDRFIFLGFLPKSKIKRERILQRYLQLEDTVIIYESPYRLVSFLTLLEKLSGQCDVVLAKDLTKLREEISVGKPREILEKLLSKNYDKNPHGEITILVHSTSKKD
ncbi:16S rRNA (cytidine(1402)-2'-O)-methyltransferase [Candidatus Dojkabacteria bacterium]|uniref:Ribosomal RNA small subunit methyltransferase I n=1 Tax=Candidatus Dojkabacteria bacterium TaxID=2099670 RepID=A0A847VEC4_9BACT|nr:16S rRNA (cytidine(1402)-2'-O)-methyltransferase [Candidatus Dojkabacteria bacterium]